MSYSLPLPGRWHNVSQLRLNIGGSGQEEQRLKQQAADLGITHAVTFLGALRPEAGLGFDEEQRRIRPCQPHRNGSA